MDFSNYFDSDFSIVYISLFYALIGAVIYFFYLKNLYDLLKAVREPNRAMEPRLVWFIMLNFAGYLIRTSGYFLNYDDQTLWWILTLANYMVAIFVVIWHYRIVRAVAASIEAEYDSRDIPIAYRPTSQAGTFMAASGGLMLLAQVPLIGIIGSLASLAYLISFIVYWVRTARFKKEIQAMAMHQDEESLIFKDLF